MNISEDELPTNGTPNGTGSEYVELNHPDRLGTKLQTNQAGGTSYEQNTLPFGTALNAESSLTTNNKRFTSNDRSNATGLDYAVNRTYDSKQGRFTQVDPIGMSAVDLNFPQALNLFSYCGNDPVNHVDPDGLFWGALWKFFKKVFKWLAVAVSVVVAVVMVLVAPIFLTVSLKLILGIVAAVANAAASVLNAFGLKKAGAIFSIISGFASFGSSILDFRNAVAALKLKAFFGAVASGATAVSRTLAAYGHNKVAQFFGLISGAAGFISGGLKPKIDPETKLPTGLKWNPSSWKLYKLVRSSSEQIAIIADATRVAGFFNSVGIIVEIGDFYRGVKDFNSKTGDPSAAYDLYSSDFWGKNQGQPLRGFDELFARFAHSSITTLNRLNDQIGRINRGIARVERGVALAR